MPALAIIRSSSFGLKADVRLAQAISHFEADLSDDQKATLRGFKAEAYESPPTIQDVMRLTADFDRHAEQGSGCRRCFGPRLTNVLRAIQQFAALGDIVLGGSQNIIACGVWGLARITMLSVVNFASNIDKITNLLMLVGRSAPRYEKMALLYPQSFSLQSHLCEYFIVIISLHHKIFKTFRKPSIGQFLSLQGDFDEKGFVSELEQWATAIREEVSILSIEEQSSRFRNLIGHSEAQLHRQRLRTRYKILDACSTYPYEVTWKELRKKGYTSQFCHLPEYRDWKAGIGPSTLICEALLGAGKSVWLANMVDDLNLSFEKKAAEVPVAYFFCRHDINDSLTAQTVIFSIVRQLLNSVQDLSPAEALINKPRVMLEFETLRVNICNIFSEKTRPLIVLEGVDEMNNEQLELLLVELSKFQEDLGWRLCISRRTESRDLSRVHETNAGLSTIIIPKNNSDIQSYINSKLQNCLESGKLNVGDAEIILEIQEALVQGAQGMFLWVCLQIEAICGMVTDEAIRTALKDLPNDLPATYNRILANLKVSNIDYQRRIFELVLAAVRPLTIDELKEALSVVPGDTIWNTAKHLNNAYTAIACCGSLITVDEETLTVRLVHHSVKQFLLAEYEYETNDCKLTNDAVNHTMASIIITYLSYGIFDSQVSTKRAYEVKGAVIPERIVRSVGGSDTVRNLALKLLKSQPKTNYDTNRVLLDLKKSSRQKPLIETQYCFYQYAISNWREHSTSIMPKDETISQLLTRFMRNQKCFATLLPWAAAEGHQHLVNLLLKIGNEMEVGPSVETAADVKVKAMIAAAKGGHLDVTQSLLDAGANVNAMNAQNAFALACAVGAGHANVVRLLLDAGEKMEAKYSDITYLIRKAWSSGYRDVVDVLVDKYSAITAVKDGGENHKVLAWAARVGHSEAVERLLRQSIDLETGDDYGPMRGRSPLSLAVEYGHITTTSLLINIGANINARDASNWTPLIWASSCGEYVAAKMLLDAGASVDESAAPNSGALYCAVVSGHTPIVELLLERGSNTNLDLEEEGVLAKALELGHDDAVIAILNCPSTFEAENSSSHYRSEAFLLACRAGSIAVIEYLVDGGIHADIRGKWQLGLNMASAGGHLHVVKAMILRGADVNGRDTPSLRTALMHAAQAGEMKTIEYLIEVGADIDAQDGGGRTALAIAAQHYQQAAGQLLLNNGASVNLTDKRNYNVLEAACLLGDVEFAEMLLKFGKTNGFVYQLSVTVRQNIQAGQPKLESLLQQYCEPGFEKLADIMFLNTAMDVDESASTSTAVVAFYLSDDDEDGNRAVRYRTRSLKENHMLRADIAM